MSTPPIPHPDDHEALRAWCEEMEFPYVPGFVQRMPLWHEDGFVTPCCQAIYAKPDPVPAKSTQCKACGDTFWVRSCPDGMRRVVNLTARIELECLQAESAVSPNRTISVFFGPSDVSITQARRETYLQLRQEARERVLARYAGRWRG